MKLTLQQIITVNRVLNSLDTPSLPPGASVEEPAKLIFDAKTTYRLAKNLRLTNSVVEDVEKSRQSTVKRYLVDGETAVRPNRVEAFQTEFGELLATDQEIDLMQVDYDDLNVDKNHIPYRYITALMGILITDKEPAAFAKVSEKETAAPTPAPGVPTLVK